jgi:hypothetical protein
MWKDKIILGKFWLQRSYGYLAIINSPLLIYLTLKSKLPNLSIWVLIPVVFILLVVLIVAGYIEYKIGLAKREMELNARLMGLLCDGKKS